MLQFLVLLAAADDAPAAQPAPPTLFNFLPIIAIPILFYLILLRPAQKKEKDRVSLLGNLKKNDKVLTASGIYGTVTGVSDKENEVTVKVDDNVRLKMTRESIVRNLTNEETAKAATTTPPVKESGA